jgi:hypothetical protein
MPAINFTARDALERQIARDRRFARDLAEYQRLGHEELRCQLREARTPPCSYGLVRVTVLRVRRAALLARLREQLAEDATRNARPFPPRASETGG